MSRSIHFVVLALVACSSFGSVGCVVRRREPPREVRHEERRDNHEERREEKHEEKREEKHEDRR